MKLIHVAIFLLAGFAGCQGSVQPEASPGISGGTASQVTTPEIAEVSAAETSRAPRDSNQGGERPGIDPPSSETENMTEKVVRTEDQWKELLTAEQYYVLREKGTERPYTNQYDHHFEPGIYACAACGQELFSSETKFDSGCGWPAFYAAKAGDRVNLIPDDSLGMIRTEVTCARCDSHLGHIFDDAPQTPTGQRYCINSVSLKFIPAEKP